MKKVHLTLSIRVDAETRLERLSDTIQELEQQTDYRIGSTENLKVLETEILRTEAFNTKHT